jgi:hypothetical protein
MMDAKFLMNFFTERQLSREELDIVIPKFRLVEFRKNDFLSKTGGGKVANE